MNIKTLIIATAAIAPVVCGCNDIKEDDRYLTVEGVTPVRAVLIEDFTAKTASTVPQPMPPSKNWWNNTVHL